MFKFSKFCEFNSIQKIFSLNLLKIVGISYWAALVEGYSTVDKMYEKKENFSERLFFAEAESLHVCVCVHTYIYT